MYTLPKYITFDAYGTLVNFQMGSATLKILGDRTEQIDTEKFLDDFHVIRWEEILKPYRPYDTVICKCLAMSMEKHGLKYKHDDGEALVDAITTWGAFPEVPAALRILRKYTKIVIMSNTEDRLIEKNIENMGVPFDDYISAEQARAYKPDHKVFEYTLRKLNCKKEDMLHVANGFEYDIIPASQLGWKKIWIHREDTNGDQEKYGPYDELPDLSGLPKLLGMD